MILADTSIWVEHLRVGEPGLRAALGEGTVLSHPHVIGELACGNLRHRPRLLSLLADLPRAVEASHAEALACIERNRLQGKGLSWTDVHLLASALLTPVPLWTRDAALRREAERLGVAWAGR